MPAKTTTRAATALLCGAVALWPVEPAKADAGDVAAGIIGGIIGGAIQSQAQQRGSVVVRRSTSTRTRSSAPRRAGISAAQRQQNRDVQTALNHFGFDAGGADGVLGRRSRAAVSGMQAFLALPSDGTLTTFERDVLLAAHARAISGNPDAIRVMSASPLGSRAVLQQQYAMMTGGASPPAPTIYAGMPPAVSKAIDEVAASSDPSAEQLLQRSGFIQITDLNADGRNDYIIDTALSGSSYWCGANDCQVLVFVSTADGYARNNMLAYAPTPASFECVGATCRLTDAQPTITAAPATPLPEPDADIGGGTVMAALPAFGAPATDPEVPVEVSLTEHCAKVTLLTTARGGPATPGPGGEPAIALAEQFCLARAHAILAAQARLDDLGVTADAASAQCAAFEPVMAEPVAMMASSAMPDVMAATSRVVLTAGLTPDQLRDTASICLGSGYRTDAMDIAMGSALLLVALGSTPHAELMGHHLAAGFGPPTDAERARPWFGRAIDALDGGAVPVFAPDQADRAAVLVWATGRGGRAAAAMPATTPVATVEAALPAFGAPAE